MNTGDASSSEGDGLSVLPVARRKIVTALFCDVVGSTALGEDLDPEVLHGVMGRYFTELRAVIERHGGTVAKFIGDAVMAVFGIPVAHEDDALRAIRAAWEIRGRLPVLEGEVEVALQFRTGINTGLVLVGEGENLAIGDAVNVAARLEQTAAPGEIVIGQETMRLVRDAVEVRPLQSLELKGKSKPVAAFRLLAVDPLAEGVARRLSRPLVGRERELRRLQECWQEVVSSSTCQLFTLLGAAGVGKSRLIAELLDRLGGEALVLRGRCLSYGEGITFLPLTEALAEVGDTAETVIRHMTVGGAAVPQEIFIEVRELLEELAADRSVVLHVDDLQWGEELLLNLLDHVADFSRGMPILVLCTARPELLEKRSSWGGGKLNAQALLLDPLSSEESMQLLQQLDVELDAGALDRIARVSEGNPLFIEEMAALTADSRELSTPGTIQALLAARLEQLDPEQRAVLELAAIEGEVFHQGSITALAGENRSHHVREALADLVRRELIRHHAPTFPGERGYRFKHLLLRDAAYDTIPKARRAQLHESFADWLETHTEGFSGLDEIAGYHLEQAARYLEELGRPDPELALAAGDRLAAAGRRAFWRDDLRAAQTLLTRSLTLTRPHQVDVRLEILLVQALGSTDVARAIEVADDAGERADAAGDEAGSALARTVAATMRMYRGECTVDELERLAHEALPLLAVAHDDDGLASVWYALGLAANRRGHYADHLEATENGLIHARRAGHAVVGAWRLRIPLSVGPMPAHEALAKLDSLILGQPHPGDLMVRAGLLIMLDRIDEGWATAILAGERLRELGHERTGSLWLGELARLIGDQDAAADYFRTACDLLEEGGNASTLATYAPRLGRVLCALGRYDDAEPLAAHGRELGDPEDILTQQDWRQAQALIHSARGQHAEGERLAREAIEFGLRGDAPLHRGDCFSTLAEVLENANRRDEAAIVLREALVEYERKPLVPIARRVRDRIAALADRQA